MPRYLTFALSLAFLLLCVSIRVNAEETRLYVSAFQSGTLAEIDPATGTTVKSIPVRDDAGIAAIAWSSEAGNGRLFVLDDGPASRLRILDPASLSVLREVRFDDRTLRFSDDRLIEASGNGRWLFVSTHRYQDGARQVRVFDVASGAFEAAPLLDSACAGSDSQCTEPLLASAASGTIFAVWPGRVTAYELQLDGGSTAKSQAALPFADILGAVATPDGHDVYVIGIAAPRDDWKLFHWNLVDGTRVTRDATTVLATSGSSLRTHRKVALCMTSDGRQIVLVRDSHVWILDHDFRLSRRFELPFEARSAALSPVGDSLLTLDFPAPGDPFRLARTPLGTGRSVVVATQLLSTNTPLSVAVGMMDVSVPASPR